MTYFLYFIIQITGLPRYLENWENQEKLGNLKTESEKSLNLKINQNIREKLGNFIKLTDWQLPIKRTSRQCWKQNVCNLCLFAEIC